MFSLRLLNQQVAKPQWLSVRAIAMETMPANLFVEPEKPEKPARQAMDTLPKVAVNNEGKFEWPILSFKENVPKDTISLDSSVFNAPLRKDILHRVVRWQLAKRRQGSHKTKSRSETSGSTRKPWAQKGSGRARVGDIRAPQWRGGYTVHGKTPRDYSYKLQKKVRQMGLRVAISAKLQEGKLAIVDNFALESPKTKQLIQLLQERGWENALFIDGEDSNENFYLAGRNITGLKSIPVRNTNVYSILQKDLLILSERAVENLNMRLAVE